MTGTPNQIMKNMSLLKSGNPALSEKLLQKSGRLLSGEAMTAKGTMNKFGFLMLMVIATSVFTWNAFMGGQNVQGYMWTGAIGGLIVALVIVFKQNLAPYLAPAYALFEGLFVGGISAMMQSMYDGIVMQAVVLTFGTIISMYFLYQFRIIQATERFRSVVVAATMGIAVFYLIAMVLGMFNINIPFLHQGSMLGIIFSLVVVVVAALNLILDFNMIEEGEAMGAPKHMEWYGAFGLLVTVVWLYIEILRLLSKLNSRD
jgi:uncharacterized YccA/Bax inhibitor family protein